MSRKQRILDALSSAWQQQWAMLEQRRTGAALGGDPEQLHQLRVVLRQIRALLSTFKNDLPSAEARHFAAEFKWLAASTSAVRDLDVLLMNLLAWSATQGEQAGAALVPVIAYLSDKRAVAQQHLRRVLAGRRYRQLVERWPSFVAALPLSAAASALPARQVAALKLAKQSLRLLKGALAIKRTTTSQELHRLRIRGKRIRYLLESLAAFFSHHKRYPHFLQALKHLQQQLGDYRDNDIAIARVSELIEPAKYWPQALPWLEAWRHELERCKRRAHAGLGIAADAFNEACRQLPS